MRVLHVIPVLAPRYGGPSQAIVGMCTALLQVGTDVLVATTDGNGPEHLPVVLERPVVHAGVPTIFFRHQWSDSLHYAPRLAGWVAAHAAEFDVVHIHAIFSHPGPAAARACVRRDIPYVVRPLGHLDPWSLQQHRLRKRLVWQLWARPMVKHAAVLHYTTAQEQRLAERLLGPTPGAVIPLGVGDELLRRPPAPLHAAEHVPGLSDHSYVLALSRIHPKKRLDLLIDVFLEVTAPPDLQQWRLVLAGDGPADYVSALRQQVAARGAGQRVLFPGWLAGQDRLAVLRNAALMALPSQQENFGLAVVEALACGVPVLISSEVNLADEVSAAGAGWVAPLDRAALVSALAHALADAPERQRRGAAGVELASARFTWRRVAEQLTTLYTRLRR